MSFPPRAGRRQKNTFKNKNPLKNLKKVVVSLQVQTIPSIIKRLCSLRPFGGKMSQFASLTIEAALAGTLFLFFSLSLILPIHMIGVYEHVQAALERVGKELAVYAYVAEQSDISVNLIGQVLIKQKVLDELGRDWLNESIIKGGSQGLSFDHTSVTDEDVEIILTYQISAPFLSFFKTGVDITQQSKRRAWTGNAGLESGDADIEMVYVTSYGLVFHRSLSCQHLNVSINEVAFEGIDGQRNGNGGKYYPCSVCSSSPGAVVFVTDYGTKYHYRQECRELSITIRRIPFNSTSLPPCKRCG